MAEAPNIKMFKFCSLHSAVGEDNSVMCGISDCELGASCLAVGSVG